MGRNKHLTPEQVNKASTLIKDAKWKPGKVAEHLGVSRTAIRNLVKKTNDSNYVKRNKPIGTQRGIDKVHHQRILEIVDEQQYKNQFELTDILNEEFGLDASRTTYIRLIHELTMNQNSKSKSIKQQHFLNGNLAQREELAAGIADFGLNIDNAEVFLKRTSDANDPLMSADLEYWDAVFSSLKRKESSKMTDSELVQAFRTYAEDRRQKFHARGIAYALIREGNIIFEGGFGKANDAMTKVSETTQWPIGEFTHSFIAVLVAQLAERGQLGWNEPISTYIPEFSLSDEVTSKYTTIIDLLANRTGVPYNELAVADIYPHGQSVTQDWLHKQLPALIMERLKHIPAVGLFRSTSVPNDLNYVVAIRVLEAIAFKSWKDQLQENILTPLGLKNTGVYSKTRYRDGKYHATGYSYDHYGTQSTDTSIQMFEPLYSQYTAAKGMFSTVHDMAEWMRSLMHGYETLERVPPVSRDTLSNYIFTGHSIASSLSQPHFSTTLHGLGWTISTYRDEQVCSHFSEVSGMTTSCIMAPTQGCGVILFTNQQDSPLCNLLPWCAMDLLLDKRPKNFLSAFQKWKTHCYETHVAEARIRNTLASANGHAGESARSFMGLFYNKYFGVARVESQTTGNGTLALLRMKLGLLDGNLNPNQIVGYVWDLNEVSSKVIGRKLPYVYAVRLLQDQIDTKNSQQCLSLTRLRSDSLEPVDKPIYFERQ
ncbi:beta-lactamase/transpeptidase-like protein [Umbelopsis sp. AD052]|nr:beta-lactamase/transpeptidase-like protein [Umbelopsis sp. AD052]